MSDTKRADWKPKVRIISTLSQESRIIELNDPRALFCESFNRTWPGGEMRAEPVDEEDQPDS